MILAQDSTAPLDWVSPVNWLHSLNRGLLAWYLCAPGAGGGSRWLDLCRRADGVLTAMNPVNDWVGSSRQGGWGALDFDGSDDRVSLAGLNSRLEGGIGGLAVAAWIYPTQTGNNDPIVSKATNSFGSGDFIVARSTSATARFLIDNGTQVVLSAGSLPQGQWGHIAASWSDDDNTARVFANGVQVATGTMDGAFTSATADLLVGQFYSDFNGLRFTGQMDDVRIWNRGLTPFEMQQVYDRSKQFNPGLLNRATVPGVLAGVAGTPLMFAYHYNDK